MLLIIKSPIEYFGHIPAILTNCSAMDDTERSPSPVVVLSPVSTETSWTGPIRFFVGCWHILSWVWSLATYVLEIGAIVWVLIFYANEQLYTLFGLTLGYFTLPGLVLAVMSLIWYYDLDRFYMDQRRMQPHHPAVKNYHKNFILSNVVIHTLLLGVVYRYVTCTSSYVCVHLMVT